MYGIIKDRSLYKGKLELTVEGSDGRLYYYTCTKHDIISKIIDLKKYERVEFKGQGRKILFLKAARINRDTGKVICTISNESGLIELSNGEVVKYSNCSKSKSKSDCIECFSRRTSSRKLLRYSFRVY